MEQLPQSSKHNELPQSQLERPVLHADLGSSESNVTTLIATTQGLLRSEELGVFEQEMHEAHVSEAQKGYDHLLEIIDRHVELVDTGNTYPQYARQGKITDAVRWLDEQIEALPESIPSNVYHLHPDFDDPNTGPEAYLNVLRSEVAQAEKLVSLHDGEQREQLEQYRDLLMTAIAKFWRYALLQ